MGFIARHAATRIGTGLGGSARINQAEEIVSTPWLYQLALEGRVFIAGHGVEEGGISDDDGVDDEEGLLVIQAPSSGTIVLPLYIRIYFDTEQAEIPSILLNYIQETRTWGVSVGTAMTGLNCLGGSSPRSQTALIWNAAVTALAVGNDENVVISERTHLLASFIGNEMATTDVHVESPGISPTEFTWVPDFPIALYAGSSLVVQAFTPSSQSSYNLTVAWAELPSSVYGL